MTAAQTIERGHDDRRRARLRGLHARLEPGSPDRRVVRAGGRVVHAQPVGDARRVGQRAAAAVRVGARRPVVVPLREWRRGDRRRRDGDVERRELGAVSSAARRSSTRYQHISTANWIARPDSSQVQAQANGTQTRVPRRGAALGVSSGARRICSPLRRERRLSCARRHRYRCRGSTRATRPGDSPHARRDVSVRRVGHLGGTRISEHERAVQSHARFDSLPGSLARTRGNELTIDAGRSFHIPESLGLGLRERPADAVRLSAISQHDFRARPDRSVSEPAGRTTDGSRSTWRRTRTCRTVWCSHSRRRTS